MSKSHRRISLIQKGNVNVANITLTPRPVLGGYAHDFGHVALREMTELSIVSMAVPLDGDEDFAKALKAAYKLVPPSPTVSVAKGNFRVVQSAADQYLMFWDYDQPDANPVVNKALKGTAYTTDQTGNWVVMELSGPRAMMVLERLCQLDIHPDVFAEHHSARTVMEHMGVLLIRSGPQTYMMASASSSAKSFLHAIELSIKYTSD